MGARESSKEVVVVTLSPEAEQRVELLLRGAIETWGATGLYIRGVLEDAIWASLAPYDQQRGVHLGIAQRVADEFRSRLASQVDLSRTAAAVARGSSPGTPVSPAKPSK